VSRERLRDCDLGADNGGDKRGVSNPRAGSGTESGKNRGVAHAPDPLSTMTTDDRRAAQNAARVDDDEDLQLVSAHALARWVMQSLLRLLPMYFLGQGIPIAAPTTAFCRGPPRGVSSSTIEAHARARSCRSWSVSHGAYDC